MDHLKIWVLTASVLMLSAPAAAQWSNFGSIEPSTPYDENWMPAGPPAIGEQRVYFNVISGSHYPPLAAATPGKPFVNPNVALLATQIEPFGLEYHFAFLGVWTDCNGDGYVGQAESALREYSAEILVEEDICPPVTGPITTWTPGANNYNGWVSEFIPIARGANLANDARVYSDDGARVWGDFDRPDEHPTYKTCPLFPWPRATYQNVGGVLNYIDCRADVLGSFNMVVDTVDDPAGLRFSNADDGRTGALGRVDIGGPEDDSHSPATFWDCDSSPAFHSGNTLNQTPVGPSVPAAAQNVQIYAVDPQPGNLDDPSPTALANHTFEGLQVLQNAIGPDANWDCDTSNDFGHDVYGQVETDFNGVDPNNKRQANWNLATQTNGRNAAASGAAGMPGDGGVGTGGTRWVSDVTWASKPGPRTLRADLASAAVEVDGAYWLSFYAQVGAATIGRGFILPSAGPGEYASWACDGLTSGISQGWNCDTTVWYQNPDGTFPDLTNRAVPGWTYHLRDVDCYDGRIGDTGLSAQPAFYGPNPCPARP